MNAPDIIDILTQHAADAVVDQQGHGMHPHVVVKPQCLADVCNLLKNNDLLKFDMLRCVTAIDRPADNRIEVAYDLVSVPRDHEFAVKVLLDRANPQVRTVSQIWPTANWHEREAYDLVGVTFIDHPDLTRILLSDDWLGHPLRKDYTEPTEYHGIPVKL